MKNAIVWGADGGIGRALTKLLVDNDWTVAAAARHPDRVADLTPHVVEADTSKPFEVELAVTTAAQMIGEVNLWVYAVGDITSAKAGDMPSDDWHRILDANLNGAFLTTHYSVPLLTSDASLLYVGAINERLRLPGLGAYAAAKAGLEAFAETVGKENRKWNVTVIRPGAVETPLWDKVPMSVPKGAMSAETLAEKIMQTYQEGQKGIVDIT